MIQSRVRPLLVLLSLSGVVLCLRLFQVQVVEHGCWAGEAARLVRVGHEIPYRRGRILDCQGRVLARDEDLRCVMLVYRDFRRGHPLGQVAHARSLLEGRAVPLPEARAHLLEWAFELVSLTPEDLRSFARGETEGGGPRLSERERAGRAADLGFYLRCLLDLDGRGWKRVFERADERGDARTLLELAAGVQDPPRTTDRARTELEARLSRSLARLETLARWLQPPASAGDDPAAFDPLGRLVAELERVRSAVEDATAAKLFAEAAGFAPGRIAAETLLACFDHTWIAELLGWDDARLAQWARTVREGWRRGWRDEQALSHLMWDLVRGSKAEPGADEFLDRVVVLFEPEGTLERALEAGPTPWREVEDLAVFTELPALFEADVPESTRRPAASALPIFSADARATAGASGLLPAGEGGESFRARLERGLAGARRSDVESLQTLAAELVRQWDLGYQQALRAALEATRRAAGPRERGPGGGLVLAEAGRERAAERAEFFLKDYGLRPRPLAAAEPSYDVVYLLTRYEADFPGFEVRELRARELASLSDEDEHPADLLVGRVSAPTIDDFVRQRQEAARLRSLEALPEREEEEQEELQRLIGEVRLPDEVKGVSGIEGLFDPELSGRNGYRETRGLQDVFGAGAEEIPVRDPEDGEDVLLTMDSELQRAAQRTLRSPVIVEDEKFDHVWQRDPVGAIVLLSIDGDVLVAASEPDDQSRIGADARGQRAAVLERTLRKPTFQPPGSVFKPFVAAWALDHGLDPGHTVTCAPIERGGFGYQDLRCWNPHGHGTVALEEALVRSCNAYFAWLGETIRTSEFLELARDFGFGEPTGVRSIPPWDDGARRRVGLAEDRAGIALGERPELSDSLRRMAANGLGRIEATPMQLARATLALATGDRIALRIVQRVGERELPTGARERLPLSERALSFVRAAMIEVAADALGTAQAALAPDELGFPVAVKTGSADLTSRKDEEGKSIARKHAWVTGWVPAEDPVAVFTLFEHDTSATSSHGVIHLARQFLQQPEVLAWLADRGVDISGVEAR